jgi:hypothetical protein
MSKTIGLAWFLREDYQQIRSICDDEIWDTYDEWKAKVTAKLPHFERVGLTIEKIIVRPAELQAWARAEGVPINAGTRATYAAMLLARQSRQGMN